MQNSSTEPSVDSLYRLIELLTHKVEDLHNDVKMARKAHENDLKEIQGGIKQLEEWLLDEGIVDEDFFEDAQDEDVIKVDEMQDGNWYHGNGKPLKKRKQ